MGVEVRCSCLRDCDNRERTRIVGGGPDVLEPVPPVPISCE